MWWLTVATMALAAPPAGVDLDDVDAWEAKAKAFLSGPAGCWVLDGTLTVASTVYTPPSLFSKADQQLHRMVGPFTGRFEDGRWTAFEHTLSAVGEKGTALDLPIRPMMGKIDPSIVRAHKPNEGAPENTVAFRGGNGGGEAMSLLQEALNAIDPAITTSYVRWDEGRGGAHLVQDVPTSDTARADSLAVTTFFPGGGAPTEVDAVFPRRVVVGDPPFRARVYDAQMHLRGQVAGERVLPASESVSFGVGALGFTLGYEQQITYARATACR